MSYIKESKTEQVTHITTVGNKCDVCSNRTNVVDDPSWHGFYIQTYFYSSDATDHDRADVCGPECYFKLLESTILDDDMGDEDNFEFDGMKLNFAKQLLKHF